MNSPVKKVSRNCLLIFLLGTVKSQAGCFIAGIALLHGVFRGHPNAPIWGMGRHPARPDRLLRVDPDRLRHEHGLALPSPAGNGKDYVRESVENRGGQLR
jgi:hypothetical protein